MTWSGEFELEFSFEYGVQMRGLYLSRELSPTFSHQFDMTWGGGVPYST